MPSTQATAQILRDVGATGPVGAVSEADRVATLTRALVALRERARITPDEASAWRQSFIDRSPRDEAFIGADGSVVVRAGTQECAWPAAQRASVEQEVASACPESGGWTPPLVLLGVQPPWALLAAWRRERERTGPQRQGFIVVHPDVPSLLLGLSVFDLSEAAGHDFFDWFCGPQALNRLDEYLASRLHLGGPQRIVAAANTPVYQAEGPKVAAIFQRTEQRRRQAMQDTAARLQQRYANTDVLESRRILEAAAKGERTLRILLFSSRGTTFVRHAIASLAGAFRTLGHETEIAEEPDAATAFNDLAFSSAIERFEPDLLILPNMPRGVFRGAIPGGIPCVCWLQDSLAPVLSEDIGRTQGEFDLAAGNTLPDLVDVFGFPPHAQMPYPVPACPRRFHDGAISDAHRARFECDVAFVSHHGETPEALRDRLAREVTPDDPAGRLVRAAYDAATELVRTQRTSGVSDRLAATARTALKSVGAGAADDAQVSRVVHQLLLPLAGRIDRHETVYMAARVAERRGWRFRIYGRGWERIPELAPYAAGIVEHGEELRACYQAAAAHLHVDLNALTHQRVFECALSGGLPLCRMHADALTAAGQLARAEVVDALTPTRVEADGTRVYEQPSTPRAAAHLRHRRWLGDAADAITVPPEWVQYDAAVREVGWVVFDVAGLLGDLPATTFIDEPTLEAGLEEAIEQPALRAERIAQSTAHIRRHLTTDVFARRLLYRCGLLIGLRSWCQANGRAWPIEPSAWGAFAPFDREEPAHGG